MIRFRRYHHDPDGALLRGGFEVRLWPFRLRLPLGRRVYSFGIGE